MKFSRKTQPEAQVDLIPMIDIVFQLILFFLVSTTFSSLPGISLNLPSSKTSEATDTSSITISADDSGALWFNSEPVTIDELDASLAAYELSMEERVTFPVRLEADSLVTNGEIVSIFDVLRKNGFSAVNLRTTEE